MSDLLQPYRVIDLTGERGQLCGQILGDMGADVILIEPPGGSPSRRREPFRGGTANPDQSLYFWAYNRNKRSLTLDYTRPQGRDLLLRLIGGADFVIESEMPGTLAGHGLGYDEMAAAKPDLVLVSITPFGQDGPRASWAESDLIVLASAGPLVLTGDDDRPPVRCSVPQGYLHGAIEAAGGALIAHHWRARSGEGQQVDVSCQQAAAQATQSAILSVPLYDNEFVRTAGGVKLGPLNVRLMWPASDGYVSITFLFGSAIGPFTRRLMEWMFEEGFCDEETRDLDWLNFTNLLLADPARWVPVYEQLKLTVKQFTKTKTKAELQQAALERSLLVAPVTTSQDVVDSEQLAQRAYWQAVEHPELGTTVTYPGAFARFSETPITYRRRPPTTGEHTREILGGELGLSDGELDDLAAKGVI